MGRHDLDTGSADTNAQPERDELRKLLDRMLVERLKAQETQAIEAASTDPSALSRYRELQSRRRQLEVASTRVDTEQGPP